MTDTEIKYKILISRLRDTKPDTGNPDLLTNEIMQAIRLKHQNTTSGLLAWIRPLLTVAALFLIGLFLYQQFETIDNVQDTNITGYIKPEFENETNCSSYSTLNLSENRKLLNQYICYMTRNTAENENLKQFYQKYLSEYK